MGKIYIILRKEGQAFFSSAIGYVVIGMFLVINSLFLWVFKSNYNILEAGFADLSSFFELAPWVLIFVIPAVTMRSFSEELRSGTIETLLTKPITYRELVIGKFLGALLPVFIALGLTLFFLYTVWQLGNPIGNLPLGASIGSYIGLGFLAMSFIALGIFTSAFSDNQVVAYLLALLLEFLFYYGFEGLSDLGWKAYFLQFFGLKGHFHSIGRGVIDSRDLVYFLSLTFIFLVLTEVKIKKIFSR